MKNSNVVNLPNWNDVWIYPDIHNYSNAVLSYIYSGVRIYPVLHSLEFDFTCI